MYFEIHTFSYFLIVPRDTKNVLQPIQHFFVASRFLYVVVSAFYDFFNVFVYSNFTLHSIRHSILRIKRPDSAGTCSTSTDVTLALALFRSHGVGRASVFIPPRARARSPCQRQYCRRIFQHWCRPGGRRWGATCSVGRSSHVKRLPSWQRGVTSTLCGGNRSLGPCLDLSSPHADQTGALFLARPASERCEERVGNFSRL